MEAEFDVIADGEVLVQVSKENRMSFVHFRLPFQTMTSARSPPRSWDSVWGKSGLDELLLKQVEVGNHLLLFTLQLCVVLHEANCFFSVGDPVSCWTWAFAVVEFVHKLQGGRG